jgi:type II secretory pathway component PulM
MIATLQSRWQRYSVKERRILLGIGAVVLALCAYAFVLLPAQKSRAHLAASLLHKQSQLQEMKIEAARISALHRAYQSAKGQLANLKASVETSARLHGLAGRIGTLQQNGDGDIELSIAAIAFDSWAAWIEALQGEHQIRVKRCLIEPGSEAGSVKIQATLTSS